MSEDERTNVASDAGTDADRTAGSRERPEFGSRDRRRERGSSQPQALTIPDFCLAVLIGTSGSGKSTFAARHFKPTEIVSSDRARGLVDDDENSHDATDDAFRLVHFIAETRLKRRRLTVIDATNVRREDRARLVHLAKSNHALAVAIVINPGEDVAHARNALRPDRQFGPHVVRNQMRSLKSGVRRLDTEGFRYVYELRSEAEVDEVTIERQRLWTDARHVQGPFDIIGDVHGCADELEGLLTKLGYTVSWDRGPDSARVHVVPPPGRRAVFLGDLVDRGPKTPDVLRIVMSMVKAGSGFCVLGNHDAKFLRWLNGRNVKPTHGLDLSIAQMLAETPEFREEAKTFVDGLVSHLWLDGGKLVVCHAGIKPEMIGRSSGAVREFCLYGETTGEIDDYGFPVRVNWAEEYRGETTVAYGHTQMLEADWLNNTICLDTACVFGGKLTALRWPEREIVSVPAARPNVEAKRPATAVGDGLTAQQRIDDLLDLALVIGKRTVATASGRKIMVEAENAAAALEVMTRFAISPKWLVHLPPTMSPPATSAREGLLEHPDEAFAYYRAEGVAEVVIEEKHMGSRALLAVCRDECVARRRFGVTTGETGHVWTRTGRAFFPDRATTEAILARVRRAMDRAGFWSRNATDWVLLDAEIMPWSAKAQSLIRDQYAATGAAAEHGLTTAARLLETATFEAGDPGEALLARFRGRAERAQKYNAAWQRYCWPVRSLDDYRVAPFHILATEGAVHFDKTHVWHMQELASLAEQGDRLVMATPFRVVELADEAAVTRAVGWWESLVGKGGEGMVVKPRDYLVRGPKGHSQPAIKVRGPEYLRIIYGPEYDSPENLSRLRSRGLGQKRSLALRELALGEEALRRFVARAPLRDVHECVFAILALESEPVDPRL
jgi:protein phosphatase